jgi:hypothetical protein
LGNEIKLVSLLSVFKAVVDHFPTVSEKFVDSISSKSVKESE